MSIKNLTAVVSIITAIAILLITSHDSKGKRKSMKIKENTLETDQTVLLGGYGRFEWPSPSALSYIPFQASYNVYPYYGRSEISYPIASFRNSNKWREVLMFVLVKEDADNYKIFHTTFVDDSTLGLQRFKFQEVQPLDSSIFPFESNPIITGLMHFIKKEINLSPYIVSGFKCLYYFKGTLPNERVYIMKLTLTKMNEDLWTTKYASIYVDTTGEMTIGKVFDLK